MSVFECLYKDGALTQAEYHAGLWYLKTWHIYLCSIQAPYIKTSLRQHFPKLSTQPLEDVDEFIKKRWLLGQEILKKHGQYTRKLLDQVICMNMACPDIPEFKRILNNLDREMTKKLRR